MAISLEQLSRKIGDQRRKVADLNSKLQAAIKAGDERDKKIDSLEAKIGDLGNSDDSSGEPSSEQVAELEKLTSEHAKLLSERKEHRLSCVALADQVTAAKEELSDLESDKKLREQSNETESWLSESSGRPDSSNGDHSAGGTSDRINVLPPTNEQLDHDLGVMFQCQILAQIDHTPASTIAKKLFQNDRVSSAMYADEHTAGGSWIRGQYLDRFIEQLRPLSVVRMMGVDTVPLDDGSLWMPKEVAGPSGVYLGEKEEANTEEVVTGDVKLVAKELVCMVASSLKLIRSPSANATNRIRNSILRGAGQTEDLYFLRGTPSGAGPTGMRYLAHADNIIPVNATVNLANVTHDLGKAELALLNANVVMVNPHWLMAPRTFVYLQNLRDGNGNLAFASLSNERPTLRGKPVHVTTQIPINLGGGNESEIMLVEATHLIIGDVPRVGFESSNVAAYKEGGVMKAAFSERKVVSQLVMENDFNALQDKAIAILTEVDWGA